MPQVEGNHGSSGPSLIPVAPNRKITKVHLQQATDALKRKGKMKTPQRLHVSSLEDSIKEFIQQTSQYIKPKVKPSPLVAKLTLPGSGRANTQMAIARLLSLPNSPIGMQDLEDVLEHVILNNLVDHVAPNNQPTDKILGTEPKVPQATTTAPLQRLTTLRSALQQHQLALECIQRVLADLTQESHELKQHIACISKLWQKLMQTKEQLSAL